LLEVVYSSDFTRRFILDKEKRALSLGALAESSNFLHPAIELNHLQIFTHPCSYNITF
jgi:hypothetical protein